MSLIVHSNAKINLYLDVLERRRDGFTNIETVFQSVALYDTLEATPHAGDITLECNAPGLPVDGRNLVLRAAKLLQAASGCDQGARLRLHKRIPIAAGLAGGSGNAAAALHLLNRLWGLNWPLARLLPLAGQLGSDVPFCLVGGTMLATGRGDRLEACPGTPPTCWTVLVHPPLQIGAGDLYASPQLTRNTEPRFAGRTAAFRAALRAFDKEFWSAFVFNRMESAAFAWHPELAEIKASLLSAGCLAAAMSGSGPTIFGVCTDAASANAIAAKLSAGHRVNVAAFAPCGLEEEVAASHAGAQGETRE